jgi:hypothetical protein
MSHRFTFVAVVLTAFATPVVAQTPATPPSTTQPSTTPIDTSKKNPTVNTSNGSIGEPLTPPATTTAPAPVTTPANDAAAAAPPAGQTQPTAAAAKVEVKVAASLANTVKISADSAFALARASADSGEISSADLEMTNNRLVYQVKMLLKNKGASSVYVDAMTGEVIKDKKFGGLKAVVEHHEENKKLLDAKRDSSVTTKP